MSKVSDVIKIANQEIGYLEKASNKDLYDKTKNAGKNNYTKYWEDLYPEFQGQAWCNCFLNWVFVKAYGEKEAKRLLCTSGDWSYYTPTSSSYFKSKKLWYTAPQAGDVIYFKNSSRINHVGLVYKVTNSTVFTIEGNTSSGQSVIPNGGGVYAKSYNITSSSIAGYGRPKYSVVESTYDKIIDIPVTCSRKGIKIVGAAKLNIRDVPVSGEIIGNYKKNDSVIITAKTKASDNNYWFKTNKGYICGLYVEGWIKEANNRWWYVKQGYKYDANVIVNIDGEFYAFNKDGWMLEASDFNNDGSIKTI